MVRNLKTCPLCGGIPCMVTHGRGYVNGETTTVAYVYCKNCGMKTARIPISIGQEKAVDEVAFRWNMRFHGDVMCQVRY